MNSAELRRIISVSSEEPYHSTEERVSAQFCAVTLDKLFLQASVVIGLPMGNELRLSSVTLFANTVHNPIRPTHSIAASELFLDFEATDIVAECTGCKLEFILLVHVLILLDLPNQKIKRESAMLLWANQTREFQLPVYKTSSKGHEELKQRSVTLEQINVRLTDELRELKLQVQNVEQHSRSSNLEIIGIPKMQGRAGKVCRSLTDFTCKHPHPPLIVQFMLRMVREMCLAAVRIKRNLVASEIPTTFHTTKVFIILPPETKGLGSGARGKLHYAGFVTGYVLIKSREDECWGWRRLTSMND
ncbi:hypothetical protein J6590_025844 [Homalodisca vitripennis]|nr:hypothetical protein J6590_025844 [Homalodisca vitripennis]